MQLYKLRKDFKNSFKQYRQIRLKKSKEDCKLILFYNILDSTIDIRDSKSVEFYYKTRKR